MTEYYHHSGEKHKVRYCECGHSHLDHDLWGAGDCLVCDCMRFTERTDDGQENQKSTKSQY